MHQRPPQQADDPLEISEITADPALRRVLDSLVDTVMVARPERGPDGSISDFHVVWASSDGLDLHGRTAEDLEGRRYSELWDSPDAKEVFTVLCRACEAGEATSAVRLPYRFVDADGTPRERLMDLGVAPLGGGVLVSWRDVTEEELSRRALAASERMLAEAQRIGRMGSWALSLGSGAERDEVRLSVQMREMIGREVGDREDLLRAIPAEDHDWMYAEAMSQLRSGDDFTVEHRLRRSSGGTIEVSTVAEVRRDDEGRVTAVTGVTQDVTEARRTQRRLTHVSRELAEEHRALAELQETLLPRALPELQNHELEARYASAADRVDVGGDWYDVVRMAGDDRRMALVVGDVAGHGIPAVGVMAEIRHVLRAHLAEGASPAVALGRVNRLFGADPDRFATCVVAELDAPTGRLRWASAGHPRPLVGTPGGQAHFLDAAPVGPPFGVSPSTGFDEAEEALDPGDALLLFTDGLVERRDETIDEGLELLARSWSRRAGAVHPLAAVLADMFRDSAVTDDVCALMCRRMA